MIEAVQQREAGQPARAGLPLQAANEEWAVDFSGWRRADPHSDGAGQVHAAVSGDRSGLEHRQPESDAGAGADDRPVGNAEAAAGRPIENGYLESFHGRVRDECLNANWFANLAEAREKIEAWRKEHNSEGRARSHGFGTLEEFARQRPEPPAGWQDR